MINTDVRITALTTRKSSIDWNSASASDVSWVFANGIRLIGPFFAGVTARSLTVRFRPGENLDIEVHDFAASTGSIAPITIEENKKPLFKWYGVTDAVRYKVYHTAPGSTEKKISDIRVSDLREQYVIRAPSDLIAGWHLFRVESIDKFGNESVRAVWPYEVYRVDTPVSNLTISNGSGSGLFDFVIS